MKNIPLSTKHTSTCHAICKAPRHHVCECDLVMENETSCKFRSRNNVSPRS